MVLGIISESTRIKRVRMADISPKYCSPKILMDSAPTPAEPMVWAMVLSERMAIDVVFVLLHQRGGLAALVLPH